VYWKLAVCWLAFVGAEVRSINFAELLKSGVLHTKLWIVDGIHAYVGSANMDYRSLTQVMTILAYFLTSVFLIMSLMMSWTILL